MDGCPHLCFWTLAVLLIFAFFHSCESSKNANMYFGTFIMHNQDCPHDIISVWSLLIILHFCSNHIFKPGHASSDLSSSPIHCFWIFILQSLDTLVNVFQDMSLCLRNVKIFCNKPANPSSNKHKYMCTRKGSVESDNQDFSDNDNKNQLS